MKKLALVGLAVVGVSAAYWFLAHKGREREIGGTAGTTPRSVLYYRDPMHPSYTSDRPGKAPDCGMELEPVYAAEGDAVPAAGRAEPPGAVAVSGERQRMLGLRLGRVEMSRTSGTLRALGRVALDENRVFPVRTGCDGWVSRIDPGATTGSTVRKGQPLASVYGRDYTTAQRSFLYALRASENPPPALPGDDTSQPTLTLREARLFLQNLGIGEAQIEQLARTRQVILDVLLTSPAAGVIVARNAFPKQRFDRDVELFRIADLTHVWIIAELLGDDQAAIPPGATARVVAGQRGAFAIRRRLARARAAVGRGQPRADPPAGHVRGSRVCDHAASSGDRAGRGDRRFRPREDRLRRARRRDLRAAPRRDGLAIRGARADPRRASARRIDRGVGKRPARLAEPHAARGRQRA